MGLWAKLTGGQTADTAAASTHRDRMRRSNENRAIDARTSAWLRAGGLTPKRRT